MTDAQILPFFRRLLSFFSKNRSLLIILLVVFLLRIPSLFEPHRYADEEIYLTLGQGVRQGLVLYRDIHDNKPPLLYVVAAVAGDLFWFRFILLVAQAVGVVLFWKLAGLVFAGRRWVRLIASGFFAILSTLPFLEGNIANGENFMIVPAMGGAYLLYRRLRRPSEDTRPLGLLAVGFLFAVAFLFKVPIAFDFFGLLLFWLFFADPQPLRERLRSFPWSRLVLVLVGFGAPILLSIIYYSVLGAAVPYVRSALLQNIGYVSAWRGEDSGLFSNPLFSRGVMLLAILTVLFFLRRRLSFEIRFVSLWTVFSLYGALLSSRPYPHYLLEPLVPFSLLIFLPMMTRYWLQRGVVVLFISLVILAYFENGFWYYSTVPYYRNFLRFAQGRVGREEYFDFWGVRRNYEIAAYLRARTQASDRIFVWGTEPAIYALSERLPVGRYAVAYHILEFGAFDETMAALHSVQPRFIVVIDDLSQFSELKTLIDARYLRERAFDGAVIYRLSFVDDD